MNQSAVRDMERWIGSFHWDWWVTLTVENAHSRSQMVTAVEQWLAYCPTAYAVVVLEHGERGRLHCHAFVGGVGHEPLQRTYLLASWKRGSITVDRSLPEG